MAAKPSETPSQCGSVRRNPKLAPDIISMRLFGPGVIEVAKAKVPRAEGLRPCDEDNGGRAQGVCKVCDKLG